MIQRNPILDFFSHLILIIGVIVVFFPIYVTFIGSTQTAEQIMSANPISLLPGTNIVESYRFALFGGKTEAGASVAPALPMMGIWRPFWVLWFLLGIMAVEVVAAWQPFWQSTLGTEGLTWGFTMWALGLLELAAGSVVLWLAVAWGLVQSLKVRLLAMLHLGFLWLGLSLLLDGVSQLLGLRVGVPVFGLGALHAMTMGFIGSLLLAMVTRVTCGHGGRPLVADAVTWALFWALQITVVWRLLAGLPNASATGMAGAAVLWVLVIGAWCLRLMNWLGRPRADGRPG